jgi:phage shock protein E
MSHQSIVEKIKAGATIVDVRTPDEFMDGAYPDAINIPVNELPARLDELGSKNKSYIVYCASGGRSAMAARFLMSAGYTDVVNAGGLFEMPELV